MYIKNGKFVLCCLCLLLPLFACAQKKVQVWAQFDTTGWIGDALELRLVCRSDAPEKVNFPVLQDQISEQLQLLPQDSLQVQTIADGTSGLSIRTVTYRFSAYKEGVFTMPSFQFEFVRNDTLLGVSTDTGLVRFSAPVVDTLQPIRGIRPIFEVGRKELLKEYFARYGYLLWIFLALAALVAAGFYLRKRFKQNKPLFTPQKPPVPPIERAIRDLKKLQEKQLWQQGQIKEYYTELTDILRLYLSDGMQIAAIEMTNEELSEALKEALKENQEHLQALLKVLERSVLVKFAKVQPQADEHEDSMKKTADFFQYKSEEQQ